MTPVALKDSMRTDPRLTMSELSRRLRHLFELLGKLRKSVQSSISEGSS